MKGVVFKVLTVAFLSGCLWFGIFWFIRAPIPSEYWLRELMICKRSLFRKLGSHRIIIAGGSSVWFGVDALKMERELCIPCFNYGLHASMRPEWIFEELREVVQSGDIIILCFEDPFYDRSGDWDYWAIRSAVAWNPVWLDRLPHMEKAKAIITGGTLDGALEIIKAAIQKKFHSSIIAKREEALEGEASILSRFEQQQGKYEGVVYSESNIDDRGDILHADGSRFKGSGIVAAAHGDGSITKYMAKNLSNFFNEMKLRGAKVVIAHSPSYLDDPQNPEWGIIDNRLKNQLDGLGIQLIDRRQDVIFTKESFYDTPWHLNGEARKKRTTSLINSIKNSEILNPL